MPWPAAAAEHDPSLITDSPAGSVASSNLSRATTVGRSGGNSVERLLYKALRGLAEQVWCGAGGLHRGWFVPAQAVCCPCFAGKLGCLAVCWSTLPTLFFCLPAGMSPLL